MIPPTEAQSLRDAVAMPEGGPANPTDRAWWERDYYRAQVATLTARIADLEAALERNRDLRSNSGAVTERLQSLLKDGQEWDVQKAIEAVRDGLPMTSAKEVYNSLDYLKRREDIVRVKCGVYRAARSALSNKDAGHE